MCSHKNVELGVYDSLVLVSERRRADTRVTTADYFGITYTDPFIPSYLRPFAIKFYKS